MELKNTDKVEKEISLLSTCTEMHIVNQFCRILSIILPCIEKYSESEGFILDLSYTIIQLLKSLSLGC